MLVQLVLEEYSKELPKQKKVEGVLCRSSRGSLVNVAGMDGQSEKGGTAKEQGELLHNLPFVSPNQCLEHRLYPPRHKQL